MLWPALYFKYSNLCIVTQATPFINSVQARRIYLEQLLKQFAVFLTVEGLYNFFLCNIRCKQEMYRPNYNTEWQIKILGPVPSIKGDEDENIVTIYLYTNMWFIFPTFIHFMLPEEDEEFLLSV